MIIGLCGCLGRVKLTSRHWNLDFLMSKLYSAQWLLAVDYPAGDFMIEPSPRDCVI